ncbi:MAG: hypothetical protein ABR573_00920, partial [Candidatus Dormibacteria bacterium]
MFAAGGLFICSIGLAHREAFLSLAGAILLVCGLVLLLLAASSSPSEPGRAYPILLVLLCVVAALAPYDPAGINPVEAALTCGAGLAFYFLGSRPLAPYRLPLATGLVIMAHAHYVLRFPHPLHQDVWTFLNGGADMLLGGRDPYHGVPFVEAGVHKVLIFTYPPAALLLLAPFRWLAGDVRWAYVMGEAVVVTTWAAWLRSRGQLTRGREALLLLPLALPRTSQAFYIFSNHEWELLA